MSVRFNQSQVSAARVMVVGCGALGNEVLKNLVLMGVMHIVVVDFDIVEIGNLTRSVFFTKEDAEQRRLKVMVIAERLRQLNPSVEVIPVCGDIAYDVGLGLIRQMDVVISCVDSRWARYCINRYCMRAGIPWVDGGIDGLEGTARVFAPGQNCYACNLGPEGLKDLARRMPCTGMIRRQELAGSAPTTSIIASVIGAVEVQEALKIVNSEKGIVNSEGGNTLCGRMFYYEGESMTVRVAQYQAYDDTCPEHDLWSPVRPTTVSVTVSVGDALRHWTEELSAQDVTLSLTNDCFVDFVSRRDNDQRTVVMLPGRRVEDFVSQDAELGGLPLSTFYQHEYRHVDATFPYPQLTLAQLGIPQSDIVRVTAGGQDYYLELSEA